MRVRKLFIFYDCKKQITCVGADDGQTLGSGFIDSTPINTKTVPSPQFPCGTLIGCFIVVVDARLSVTGLFYFHLVRSFDQQKDDFVHCRLATVGVTQNIKLRLHLHEK